MSAAEAQRLRRDERLSVAQIQRRLGVSKHVLTDWLRGVPPPAWTARPNAKDDLRERALGLRVDGWSINDIALELGVARSTSWNWVKHLPLDPDTDRARLKRAKGRALTDGRWTQHRSERDAARAAVTVDAARDVGTLSERELLLIGAAIYWCEGTKSKSWRRDDRVVFVNSDPKLIAMFLAFLRVAGVAAEEPRFRLSIHESADVDAATQWWVDELGLTLDRFHVPNIKRHNPTTVRHNVGDEYHGCLVISVPRRKPLYWRMEGLMNGIAGACDMGSRDA